MKKNYLLLGILLLLAQAAFSQMKITGKISSAEGTPLPGATITEKNSKNAVVSDAEGNYSITVASKNAILLLSYAGFETQKIDVNNKPVLNVALSPKLNALDQVVVIGYGSQRKRDLTGAIARVRAEDFAPGTNSNAAQLLTGAAAGVVVSQTSAAPGGGIKVQIRGAGSINSSNDVLFVVDGLPGVDPSSLSPGDIESIEVLKDASAAAIYGTRAANGVVLVTTKKGKAGITNLSYSTYVGNQEVRPGGWKFSVSRRSDYKHDLFFNKLDNHS